MAASLGFDHVQRHHRIHLDGHVVAGDHVLRRNFQHLLPQRDAHHLVDRPENENDAGALGRSQNAAQPEDDAALVLAQNLDGVQQVENDDGAHYDQNRNYGTVGHGNFLSLTQQGLYSSAVIADVHLWRAAGSTRSSNCSCPVTRSAAPLATGRARHGLPDLALHQHMALRDRGPPSRLPGSPPSRPRRCAPSFFARAPPAAPETR